MNQPTSTSSAALLGLESHTRATITRATARTVRAINAALSPAVRAADPAATGGQVLAQPGVHTALADALQAAQTAATDTTRAAYTAAAQLALAAARDQLAGLGHELPDSPPDPGTDTLARLVADIATAVAQARADLQNDILTGYDGVTASTPAAATKARVVTTNAAVQRAARRLNARLAASAVVAVYAGAADTEQALWRDYTQINPHIAVTKRWQVISPTPCSTCRQLDGQQVGIDEAFDHTSPDGLPVWGSLHAPPRHPNCRCRLAFDT